MGENRISDSSRTVPAAGVFRFGSFELDLRAGELRKSGIRLKLHNQPFDVLVALLERRGQLVTREELQQKLWVGDTFVDFDQGLNKAINKLREALGDDAESPRFIETSPRRGYRFVAPATFTGESPDQAAPLELPRAIRLPRLLMGAISITVLLAGIVAFSFWHRGRGTRQELKIVPFTSYPGEEMNPSFSPDGNQIAFAWTGGETRDAGGFDLYVKQLGSEKPLRLTAHPASTLVPAWSPDGQSIAFTRVDARESGVFLIPALGGPERKLLSGNFGPEYDGLSWSPDAKWLAFSDNDRPREANWFLHGEQINIFNVETFEKHSLSQPAPDCSASVTPVFSPDGKSLAYVCLTAIGTGRIYVQALVGGTPRELTKMAGVFGVDERLAWSVDGRWILYGLWEDGLWRIPALGGKPEKLLFAPEAAQIALAHSGNRLAYILYQGGIPEFFRLDLSSPAKPLHSPVRIIASSRGQGGGRISPDGRRVSFQSFRSGSLELWVSGSDGSNPMQLTFFGSGLTGAAGWSPDSRRLVIESAAATGNNELYIVSIEGGPPQHLPTAATSASHPSWSADGQWIYFGDEKAGGIWKVSPQSGASVRLTQDQGYRPQESMDAMRLFYAHETGPDAVEIRSVPMNGGDARPLPGMPLLRWGDAWVPTREGIYFLDPGASAGIQFFDFPTRQVHRVTPVNGRLDEWGLGPSISVDGRTLIFAQVPIEKAGTDIILVEGFR